MMRTTISPFQGLGLVFNKMLLLLRRERIVRDHEGSTSVLLSNEVYAFMEMQTMMCHMAFHTYFARELDNFFLSIVRFGSSFLLGIGLHSGLILRRRDLFLVLLVLVTKFLCRLHIVNRGGRKRSRFGRGVH